MGAWSLRRLDSAPQTWFPAKHGRFGASPALLLAPELEGGVGGDSVPARCESGAAGLSPILVTVAADSALCASMCGLAGPVPPPLTHSAPTCRFVAQLQFSA